MRATNATSGTATAFAVAALLVTVLVGCGSGAATGGGAATCTPVRSEPLDRRSLVHVLPGAKASRYLTDPPTSGPHQPSPPLQGVVAHPIDRPVQVGVLESGKVLLQYRGLDAADRRALVALAGPKVVVAPALRLPTGTRIAATAWLTKQLCGSLDPATLQAFVRAHVDRGPGRP